MRIGIDARFYGSLGKGLGRYTERLIESLETIDHTNEYFVFLRKENMSEYRPAAPNFVAVLADYSWYGFAEQFLFPLRLLRYKLDVVHFTHFNVPLLYPKRFIVTIHDLILLQYPTVRSTTHQAWWYWIKFFAYRLVIYGACLRARMVIVVSQFTRDDVLKAFPFVAGKIRVTLEGACHSCYWSRSDHDVVTLSRLGLLTHQSENKAYARVHDILKPYFLYVGNAYPHKNLQLIAAMAERFPEYHFVLVGREDYFYRRLKREQTRENLHFVGFVTDAELAVLYRYGVAYFFPSLYEGFGLPPLEAMSYGLPVVSSNRGSLPEILGSAALYIYPDTLEQCVVQLKRVSSDAVLRDSLRADGYQRIRRFSWLRMARQTRNVYEFVSRK